MVNWGSTNTYGGIGPSLCFVSTVILWKLRDRLGSQRTFVWPDPHVEVKFLWRNSSFVVEFGDAERMRKIFEEKGFVVIANVLSLDTTKEVKSLIWDYVEGASAVKKRGIGLNREDPASWTPEAWPDVLEGGVFLSFGVGQSRACWKVRTLPNVHRVFRDFWRTEGGLLTSFDSLLLWRRGERTEKGWFHVDQNPSVRRGFANVQGLVNLVKVVEGRGGNVLVPGSHKMFDKWRESKIYRDKIKEVDGDDWMEISGDDVQKAGGGVMVEMNPGDLLLWDSRTIHCSNGEDETVERGGGGEVTVDGGEVTRAAVLVTMYPEERVGEDVRKRRREGVERGATGTHWANKMAVLGAERGEEVDVEANRVRLMRRAGVGIVAGAEEVKALGGWDLV